MRFTKTSLFCLSSAMHGIGQIQKIIIECMNVCVCICPHYVYSSTMARGCSFVRSSSNLERRSQRIPSMMDNNTGNSIRACTSIDSRFSSLLREHLCKRGITSRNYVCPSICVFTGITKLCTADILIQHKRLF